MLIEYRGYTVKKLDNLFIIFLDKQTVATADTAWAAVQLVYTYSEYFACR